jgi:hypothetical protein
MTMTAGSVTVADDGAVTKTGMAAAIYDEFVGNYAADTSVELPAVPDCIPILRGFGSLATNLAQAIVTYIRTNAEAKIASDVGALQTSTAAGNPTDPNGFEDKYLPIV